MIRYFALATVLVLAVAIAATAYVNRDLIRIKIASVYAPYPAKPEDPWILAPRPERPFRGEAPWALSALPECLTQIEEVTGSFAYVRSHLPKGAIALRTPVTLLYGDCTIRARETDADVDRGPDRFHIPPEIRFYLAHGKLVLFHSMGGRGELRVYQRSAPTSP